MSGFGSTFASWCGRDSAASTTRKICLDGSRPQRQPSSALCALHVTCARRMLHSRPGPAGCSNRRHQALSGCLQVPCSQVR